jgi:hypothetical protein
MKSQYLKFMCFVCVLILGIVTITLTLTLSLNTRHLTLSLPLGSFIPSLSISSIKLIMGIMVHNPSLNAINFNSVLLSAVSVYSFDDHVMGHLAKDTM